MKRAQIKTKVVLTQAAMDIIKRGHSNRSFNGRTDAHEPPAMAPSQDPNDYSRVSIGGPAAL